MSVTSKNWRAIWARAEQCPDFVRLVHETRCRAGFAGEFRFPIRYLAFVAAEMSDEEISELLPLDPMQRWYRVHDKYIVWQMRRL
jgi:hypothetical protein